MQLFFAIVKRSCPLWRSVTSQTPCPKYCIWASRFTQWAREAHLFPAHSAFNHDKPQRDSVTGWGHQVRGHTAAWDFVSGWCSPGCGVLVPILSHHPESGFTWTLYQSWLVWDEKQWFLLGICHIPQFWWVFQIWGILIREPNSLSLVSE